MTYQQFIDAVGRLVRDTTAWPNSATKLAEQIRLSYASFLTYMLSLPISELPVKLSGNLPLQGDVLLYADLPTDAFTFLPQQGVRYVLLDGKSYFVSQAQSVARINRMSVQKLFSDLVAFGFDTTWDLDHQDSNENQPRMFFIGAETVKVGYVALPEKPTAETVASLTIPLDDPHVEPVAELVASYVSGQVADTYSQQFHQIYSQVFGSRQTRSEEGAAV